MDFFNFLENKNNAPLSERMRAEKLDDILGQSHILGPGSLLRRAIMVDRLGSCIFYGPPGIGKTTLANVIAKTTNAECAKLNAVSSGVSEAKEIISKAKERLALYGRKTYLLLDECHRWSKAQSDCVLSAIEKGEITFIGSTTENPYISMTKAIVSRCRIFQFKSLTENEIRTGLLRALSDKRSGLGNYDIQICDEAFTHIVRFSNGDLRIALDSLELAVMTTALEADGKIKISLQIAEEVMQKRIVCLDDSDYYDILSAFCKSLRGSDPDAAIFYAAKLIMSGCDPMLIARRLVVHAAEDVGLADPFALSLSVSAMNAVEKLGAPEGLIPLNEAIIYVSVCPKSNSVVLAMEKAKNEAINLNKMTIPTYLLNSYQSNDAKNSYKYPHDYGGWVEQSYLPEEIAHFRFYIPSQNGKEKVIILNKDN